MTLPARFDSVEAVEDFMTTPSEALIADLARIPGDIMVLGVGGKMGPTLARLAKRAAPGKRVMGVARFSEPGVREALVEAGVEPVAAPAVDSDTQDALQRMREEFKARAREAEERVKQREAELDEASSAPKSKS